MPTGVYKRTEEMNEKQRQSHLNIHWKWNEERVLKELKEITIKLGHFPTQSELRKLRRTDLINITISFGGLNKFRKMFGLEPIHKPKGYWTEERILIELESIIKEIGHFPSSSEIRLMNRDYLIVAICRCGKINKFRKLLQEKIIKVSNGYWTEELICKELKEIINKIGHFPSSTEIRNMDDCGMGRAMVKYGNIDYFRSQLGYPLSLEEFGGMRSYVHIRGYKSEKEVKKLLIKYCKYHDISEPTYNKKLSKGNVIEFVFEAGCKQTIGIDVTNTKSRDGRIIKHKYIEKDYHKYLDKLWIVVLSNIFTTEDYIKFNEESPDNVEIMSIWDMVDILQIDIDEYSKYKLQALETCTIRTKNDLINQLKNKKEGI